MLQLDDDFIFKEMSELFDTPALTDYYCLFIFINVSNIYSFKKINIIKNPLISSVA